MKQLEEVKRKVLKYYRRELGKRRRGKQVDNIILREKNLDKFVTKCAENLIEWHLAHLVGKYVECQFFALNYMPYLPKMYHIASDKGFERWQKYSLWYKKKLYVAEKKKVSKKLHKKKEVYSSLKYLDKTTKFEEKEKERFFNTLKGFLYCIENTTLYNKRSNFCEECKFKKYCKKKLKDEYRVLYRFRKGLINRKTFMKKVDKGELLL
jgi:hypothetical protein